MKPRVAVWSIRTPTGAVALDDDVQGHPVVSIVEALEATYETDAHLQAALLLVDGEPEELQPRLRKAGLANFSEVGEVVSEIVFVDVDNADHATWTPAEAETYLLALLDAHADEGGVLEHAAVYATRGGWRAVYAVDPPIPAERYRATLGHPGSEKYKPSGLLRWLGAGLAADLKRSGQIVDASCNQWMRCFRAPRVVRDGCPTDGFMDLEGLDGTLDVSRWLDVAEPEVLQVPGAEISLERPPDEKLTIRQWMALGLEGDLKRRMPGSGSGADKLPSLGVAVRQRRPWFGPGERNTETYDAVTLIADLLFEDHRVGGKDIGDYAAEAAEHVYRALAPCISAACRSGVSGTEEGEALDELWSMVERQISVEVARYAKAHAETQVRERKAEAARERVSKPTTKPSRQGEGAEDLDDKEEGIEEDLEDPAADLPYIVVHGAGYYILDAREEDLPTYFPFTKNPNLVPALMYRGLGDKGSDGGGPLDLWLRHEGGKFRPMPDIVIDYGEQVTEVVVAHGMTRPRFDLRNFTLEIPGVTPYDVEPVFHEKIDTWLRLLAGDDVPGLLDWLATLTRLDFPTCAIYLQGPSHAGKGLFAKCVATVFGAGFCTFKEAVSRFNDGLVKSPVVFLDEGLPDIPELKDVTAAFRSLVAESEHRVEPKGVGMLTLRGAARVIIAANNGDALPLYGQHTADDIDAVTSRIRWFGCDSKPAKYLQSIGGRQETSKWVGKTGSPGDFARHVRWLEENREVQPGTRYLVEGVTSQYHESLAMSADRLKVLHAVGAAMLRGGKLLKQAGISIEAGEGEEGRDGKGTYVAVGATKLRKQWVQITGDNRAPTQREIAGALSSLTRGGTVRRDSLRVYLVPLRYVVMASDRMGLATWEIERRAEVLLGGGKVEAEKG